MIVQDTDYYGVQGNEQYTPRLLSFDIQDNIAGYNREKGRMMTEDQLSLPNAEQAVDTW